MTERIDTSPKNVRNFGLLFSFLCSLGVALSLWKGSQAWRWAAAGAFLFLIAALRGYPALRPVYIAWMKFAFALAWINTRIILGLFFFLVMTPVGLAIRLWGKDLLDKRIDRSATTYWVKRGRTTPDRSRYERLF